MANKRKVEVFSAGCAVCEEAVSLVRRIACDCCDVSVADMRDEQVAAHAKRLAIPAVPAVVVDGQLASCCGDAGPTESVLRAAGIGQPL